MQFTKLARSPAYRILADAIEREIVAGRIRPGELLPTELTLAQQFGVNRSTVREAIRALEETGLIQRVSGRRLVVSLPATGALAAQMTRAMIMHEITFQELWEITMAIEPVAAELAARNIDAEHAQLLTDNLERTARALGDTTSLVELDIEFHAIVAAAARNRVLLLAREPLSRLFYPAFAAILTSVSVAGTRLLEAHRAIAEAIVDSDAVRARDWMQKHIADFRRGYLVAGLDMNRPVQSAQAREAQRPASPA